VSDHKIAHVIVSILLLCMIGISTLCGCGADSSRERISYEKSGTNDNDIADNSVIPEKKVKKNVFLAKKNVGGMSETELRAVLLAFASKYDKLPKDASLNAKTWAIFPDKDGKRLNVEKTLSMVLNAREGKNNKYALETVKAKITKKGLSQNIHTIANFTTTLIDRRDSRINNIEIAKGKIDFKILKPGQEFSFNNTVGRRTAEKGYEEAPIIIRTPEGPKSKNAKGGGVCQISTTIYNAVEECGLRVTERHLHSKDIGYVPKGDDATVSYGSVDLKFVNNRKYEIMLRLYLKRTSLTVRIIENRN
jgi:vancomycin resistance protein YoaR